jgi:hypothetical protein
MAIIFCDDLPTPPFEFSGTILEAAKRFPKQHQCPRKVGTLNQNGDMSYPPAYLFEILVQKKWKNVAKKNSS